MWCDYKLEIADVFSADYFTGFIETKDLERWSLPSFVAPIVNLYGKKPSFSISRAAIGFFANHAYA